MDPSVLLTPEAFMRPTGGVRRYAVELEKAIGAFGSSERVGEGLGLGAGRLAGRRVGGSLARFAVDMQASSLAKRADIAHSVYYDCSMLGKHLPLIVSFHDCIHERFAATGSVRSALLARDKRRSVERARFVLSVSESTARDVAEFYGLGADRSLVLNPPVSEVFTSAISPTIVNPFNKRTYFIFVGTRSAYKNWALLVSAIGSLSSEIDVALVSVGGGPLTAEEQRLVGGAGLRGNQHEWLDRVDDSTLATLYRGAVAAVCPSDYEGFGYPVAEALCAGGRAIASDGGSLAEFEQYGARLFPAGSMEGLRIALSAALDAGNTVVARSRATAVARFGKSRFTEELARIYGVACAA